MTEPSQLDLDVSIIARDARRTIADSIGSVRGLARQIIVVDSGSTDGTQEICAQLGCEVIDHQWEGYGRQKQFALDACSAAWVLCIDSDESPDAVLADEIRRVVSADDSSAAGYAFNVRPWLGGVELRHTWQPDWKLRLVRREQARWMGDYHERLQVDGRVGRLRGNLRHDANPDVTDLIRKQARHGVQSAETYFAGGKRGSLLKLLVSPPSAVIKQLVLRNAWLDGWRGWAVAFATGISAAAKHMRLLELSRGESASAAAGGRDS